MTTHRGEMRHGVLPRSGLVSVVVLDGIGGFTSRVAHLRFGPELSRFRLGFDGYHRVSTVSA